MTGNPYHDETGRFCSKGEMGEAVERLNQVAMSATNFEDFSAARDRYTELKNEFEAAQGVADLDLPDFADPAVQADMRAKAAADVDAAQARRVRRAGAQVTDIATKLKAAGAPAQPKNTFGLAAKHSYKQAEIFAGENGQMYSRKFTGSKAGEGYRSVTEYAKDIRSDLAEAQQKGYLPKNLKFSVNSSKYSGGQSLTVRIHGGADKDLYVTGDPNVQPEWGQQIYTPEAREVIKRTQGIVDAYRWDASEPQIDYFNTNFYGFVNVEDERKEKFNAGEKDKARAAREAAKTRKDLTARVEAAGEITYFNHSDRQALLTGKSKDGEAKFGFVPGTEVLLVERNHRILTRDGYKSQIQREMYDMTGLKDLSSKGARPLVDVLAEMDERELGLNFARQKFFPAKIKATRRRYA